MKKKRSITRFVLTTILVFLGLFLTIFQFDFKFLGIDYTYNGFIGSLNLGMDIDGGYLAVYNVSSKDGLTLVDSDVNQSINRISNYLKQQGHDEVAVVKQSGENVQIRVEISKGSTDISNVLTLLGEPKALEIKKENSETAEVYLTGKNLKSASASRQLGTSGYVYGVSIEFDEEGTKIFKNLTSELAESNGTLYLFLGGSYYSQAQVSNAITDGKTFISGGMSSLSDAQEYATKIISGTLNTNLTLVSTEEITSQYSKNITTMLILTASIISLIVLISLYIMYKNLGLISSLSLAIFAILQLFLMQAIPVLTVTIEGFIALFMAFMFAAVSHLIMIERMKDDYKLGKKISASVKNGVKKASINILDISAVGFIACVVLYIFGGVALKSFAFVLGLGLIVNLFTTLVLSRIFFNWYLHIDNKNNKKINFKREANINEIE